MPFLKKILQEKQKEVAHLPDEKVYDSKHRKKFFEILQENANQIQVIAEVKRASPSKGVIDLNVDPVKQAQAYEQAGAAMISVLTEPYFFKGNITDLKKVSDAVTIPVLCKDFIISKKQLIRAKNHGASVVLLIVAALSPEKLKSLYEEAIHLDLEVLVEVHNQTELELAEQIDAKLIGVNNRDLHHFTVDISTSEKLLLQDKKDRFYISESGFKTREDVTRIKEYYAAVLVGETLMKSSHIAQKISELQVEK
ncbi:indole-3-glycerol phosphate synthase TrpC [Listeria sp. PSOL-1]|uniref:indole-3-glycerol phosphate synthase TrpC n=1 Tax=Listeria sp. PSOL-1 TaxID=1844999 RepID=UPI0013D6A0B0|nr:indole-3-glycerol phosphate synthase TrpC [Listeria sp. PSOL-1]